jgi:hypothetical protein
MSTTTEEFNLEVSTLVREASKQWVCSQKAYESLRAKTKMSAHGRGIIYGNDDSWDPESFTRENFSLDAFIVSFGMGVCPKCNERWVWVKILAYDRSCENFLTNFTRDCRCYKKPDNAREEPVNAREEPSFSLFNTLRSNGWGLYRPNMLSIKIGEQYTKIHFPTIEVDD